MNTPLFDRQTNVGSERVRLCLFRFDSGFALERQLEQQDGTLPVQVLPLRDIDDLDRFALADPYYERLAACYAEIRRKIGALPVLVSL